MNTFDLSYKSIRKRDLVIILKAPCEIDKQVGGEGKNSNIARRAVTQAI